MNKCKKCNQVFKYRNAEKNLKEHYADFHAKPRWNKDGTIRLNAVHQITLIVKRGKMWKTVLENRLKNDDKSGFESAKQLQEFEKKHNVKFTYRNEKLGFISMGDLQ